jgi:plastocyanin
MRTAWRAMALAASRTAFLAVLLAGCAASVASSAPVATDHVDLPKSYLFAPTVIEVKAGATVTWTDSDNFTHSVQLDGEAAPGLVMKPGEQVERTFVAPGTYPYVCAFHSQQMRGTVIVSGD